MNNNDESSPFRIRLEVLKLAQEILESNANKENSATSIPKTLNVSGINVGNINSNSSVVHAANMPLSNSYKSAYNEDDVIATANKLYEFVKNRK